MAQQSRDWSDRPRAGLTRRSLLLGLGALSLGSALTGCNRSATADLRVDLLRGSIPPQLPGDFRKSLNAAIRLNFVSVPQLSTLFAQLQTWAAHATLPHAASPSPVDNIADLVTLGDFWLAAAIQQQLIQPLPLVDLAGWQQLGEAWQQLVRRNDQGIPDAQGAIWAAPYRWGSVAIAYRKDKFDSLGWVPTRWEDLWRPELRGRISLLDSPRTVIGIVLKRLGQSVNTENPAAVPDLVSTLAALHQQTRFYSSTAYLQPLLLADTWVAMGWSTDLLPIVQRDSRIEAIVPEPGTIVFADLWVRPAGAVEKPRQPTSLFTQWIDFCWSKEVALSLSLLSDAASPILTTLDRRTLPSGVQSNPLLLPAAEILERSEFLLPVSTATIEQYGRLWRDLRVPVKSS